MRGLSSLLLVALVLGPTLASRIPRPALPSNVKTGGGTKWENGDLKYIVEIREALLALDSHLGSGVLVSPKWVLSTQEATKRTLTYTLYVNVGKSDGSKGTRIDAKGDPVKETTGKILALVQLKTAVKLDNLNRPINLPFPGSHVESGKINAVVAGWGDGDKDLKGGVVTVLSGQDCKALVKSADVLCSSGSKSGTGACEGDDGSPLVQHLGNGMYILLGVATATEKVSCSAAADTSYVDVAKYTEWVLQTVQK